MGGRRRNVELKARIENPSAIAELAMALGARDRGIIEQDDIFFPSPWGRLKLRIQTPGENEIIFYARPDAPGPKTSEYEKCSVAHARALSALLDRALGASARVRKTRHLLLLGRTRIHIDRVEGLGDFMELEVALAPGEPEQHARDEAADLARGLGVREQDFVAVAYADLCDDASGAAQRDGPE